MRVFKCPHGAVRPFVGFRRGARAAALRAAAVAGGLLVSWGALAGGAPRVVQALPAEAPPDRGPGASASGHAAPARPSAAVDSRAAAAAPARAPEKAAGMTATGPAQPGGPQGGDGWKPYDYQAAKKRQKGPSSGALVVVAYALIFAVFLGYGLVLLARHRRLLRDRDALGAALREARGESTLDPAGAGSGQAPASDGQG